MAVLDVILDVILDAVLDVAGVWTLKLDGFILGCGSFADARKEPCANMGMCANTRGPW